MEVRDRNGRPVSMLNPLLDDSIIDALVYCIEKLMSALPADGAVA